MLLPVSGDPNARFQKKKPWIWARGMADPSVRLRSSNELAVLLESGVRVAMAILRAFQMQANPRWFPAAINDSPDANDILLEPVFLVLVEMIPFHQIVAGKLQDLELH